MIAQIVDGTRLFIIEDEGVVYVHGRQEVFALNTTATYLWCLIEEGQAESEILRDYAAAFDLSPETAVEQLAAVLQNFHALGLIDLPDRRARTVPLMPKAVVDQAPPIELPALREVPIVAQQYYRLFDTDYLVRYSDLEQLEWVAPVLKNFALPDAVDGAEVVDLQHDGNEIFLYRAGVGVDKCGALDELAPMVQGGLWVPALDRVDYLLSLHTGVVQFGDGCILLPAAAGSGKSSTTAALVHGGYPYLSDEVALLMDDYTIRALPLALCFKSTGWDIVSRYFAQIGNLPTHRRRGDGKIAKYLSLPEHQRADPTRRYPAKAIIFPKYTPGSATIFEPVPKTQALDRMFRECVTIPGDLSEQMVARLVHWITGIACYTLEFSDLDAAVATLRDALKA